MEGSGPVLTCPMCRLVGSGQKKARRADQLRAVRKFRLEKLPCLHAISKASSYDVSLTSQFSSMYWPPRIPASFRYNPVLLNFRLLEVPVYGGGSLSRARTFRLQHGPKSHAPLAQVNNMLAFKGYFSKACARGIFSSKIT